MSQVIRKYNSGGQTDKPKLLSVKGLGDFNQDDLIKRGYRDVDEYASSKGLGNTAAADFRNAVQYMLEGISNGTMTMDAMGNFQDATGQKSSTGELDRKKFLGIKTGVKNTENNAYGLAADYLYNIIKGFPQYKQPEVKKERFNANKLMEDAISREWYGGNTIDYNNWFRNRTEQDRNALMGRIWDSADYNQIFQSHDWSGTNIKSAEDLAALGRAYGAAITNNKLDNDDYNTFAALGGTGLDKFIRPTQQATTPQSSTVEGQQGKVDTSWTNSEYDRTVDDKGKYHIYKKGTNEEVSGILPGNVFKGVGNRYAFDGNIYDDSNLPEQYRQDITRARQAQLGEYTSLTDNNPFTKMLKGQGYNYITNLSQFASGVGNNVLYGAYSNPSDVNGKMGFYLKNPTTGKTTRGSVELNKLLGEYQFIGEDGNVINLGAYNPNGARERQGVKFVDYTDTSKANWENLFNTWMQDPDLSNPASEAYRMVQNTLSKWIDSKQSPFVKYGKDYKWAVGDNDMNVARNNDGTLSWYFNNKVESEDESSNELQRLLSIPTAERSREINDRILKLQGYKKGGVISAQLGTKFIEDTTPLKVSPVQSPNAKAVRTINSVSSILEPFIPKSNLPAVIPASRNAQKVVASQTIQPSQRLDQFIEGQIPGGRQFGRQRAKTEGEYRDVFHPAAEREYNQVWDEAIKNRKDFGYEEVSPKRSPYTPPTPTEVYVEPKGTIKDPNARYLWELINKKSSTSHIKRDNPPHKGKSKKKKTSKDDRVTKKAEGGLIQFLQGGNTVDRIKAKDMSSWNRSKALSGYDFGADVDRWKSQYTGSDDWRQAYAAAFNGGEDIYDQLTSMTGNYFGGNYNYSVQDPLAKHRQVTFRGTNQGFDDLIRKGIVGYGTTEGNSGFDVYAGDRTGNRTLGRGMSAEDVSRFNEQLRTRGLELYDKGDGGYRLRLLQDPTSELGEVVVTAPRVSNTSNPSSIKRTPGNTKKGLKLNVAPEEVLALGRMVGGLAANNRAARIYKEGLKPTLLDTFENTVPLQGNFQAVTNAEQQAGNLESVAARPRTSDASLQLAGELEASGRAGQARFQGGLQDAEMFYKTRMLGQQESDAAKARRVEVANRNRASMNAIDAAKKQIDAGRVTANYQQVIAPYLAGVENRFRQTKAMRDQLALESYLNEANSNYNTSAAKIMEDYKDDPIGAQRELSKLQKGLQSDMLKKRSSLISTPWLVQFSGKGSKLSYAERAMLQRAKDFNKRLSDDNKQFHKDVMESKREHNKMITNMSALTAALIKKGMQL